jgi:hypothetical protein
MLPSYSLLAFLYTTKVISFRDLHIAVATPPPLSSIGDLICGVVLGVQHKREAR